MTWILASKAAGRVYGAAKEASIVAVYQAATPVVGVVASPIGSGDIPLDMDIRRRIAFMYGKASWVRVGGEIGLRNLINTSRNPPRLNGINPVTSNGTATAEK